MACKIKYVSIIQILSSLLFLGCLHDNNTSVNIIQKPVNKIVYKIPYGFEKKDSVGPKDLKYSMSLKHSIKKLEIRYIIIPKNSSLKKSSNNSFRQKTEMITKYISKSNEEVKFTMFRHEDAKEEYNADIGVTASFRASRDFDFKYIILVGMHRNDYGHAYTLFLLDNIKETQQEIQKAFHSMKFR